MKKRKAIRTSIRTGPFNSLLEKRIFSTISQQLRNSLIHINPKGLLPGKRKLELDLYFPHYKLGIEIQGPSHFCHETHILNDYYKKKIFSRELGIDILYIYTHSYPSLTFSRDKCISILKKKENEKIIHENANRHNRV